MIMRFGIGVDFVIGSIQTLVIYGLYAIFAYALCRFLIAIFLLFFCVFRKAKNHYFALKSATPSHFISFGDNGLNEIKADGAVHLKSAEK